MKIKQLLIISLILALVGCDDTLNIFWDNKPCSKEYHSSKRFSFPIDIDDTDWTDYFDFDVIHNIDGTPYSYFYITITSYAPYVCLSPHTFTYKCKVKLNLNIFSGCWDKIMDQEVLLKTRPHIIDCNGSPKYIKDNPWMNYVFTEKPNLLGYYICQPPEPLSFEALSCDENVELKTTIYCEFNLGVFMEKDLAEHFKDLYESDKAYINELLEDVDFDFYYTR